MKRTTVLLAFVLIAVTVVTVQTSALDAGPVLAQETETTINPDRDAYTVQTEPTENYGKQKNLLCGSQLDAELPCFIRFPIPEDILTNGVLVKAEMRAFCKDMPSVNSREPKLKIQRNRSSWGESSITYQKSPRPEGSNATWVIGQCKNEWTPWVDVTELTESWFEEPEKNFGFQIMPIKPTDNDLFMFTSREGGRPFPAGAQPQLRLVVVPPPTATPTPSNTYTPSPTLTPSATPTITNTPDVTNTPTPTNTATPTNTPEPPPDIYLPVTVKVFDISMMIPGAT